MHVSEIQDITILLYWQTCLIRANQMGKMGESEPWAHVATRQTWTNLRVDFQTTDSHNRAPGRSLGSKNWNDEISITSSSNLIWFWAEPLTHALVWVSYGGFLKWEYPKIFHVNRIFHQILGYFGVPPFMENHIVISQIWTVSFASHNSWTHQPTDSIILKKPPRFNGWFSWLLMKTWNFMFKTC